jgi:hypothetical protein
VGTKPNSGSDFSFEVRTLSRQDTLIVLRKPVYLRSSGLHGFGTVLETPTFRRAYEFQLKEVLRLLSDRREHPIPTRHIGVRIPPPQPGSPGIRPDRPISRERPAIGRLSCIRESLRVAHGPIALGVIRGLRRTLGDECDLAWRAEAQSVFEQNGFDAPNLYRQLSQVRAVKALKQ